jgi:threonylcarbamoyladenosine tRNA methylthiotransferase MtaB
VHPRVCRHFHIPLQSGDDFILKRMGRPYHVGFVRDLLIRISDKVPDACIGLDVMVGFPGEDDLSFERTASFIRESGAAYLHVFPFSPRSGTRATALEPKVPEPVARMRVEKLGVLSRAMKRHFYQRFLGRELTVVPETDPDPATKQVRARTDNYIPVIVTVPPVLEGKPMFPVTLQSLDDEDVMAVPTFAASE